MIQIAIVYKFGIKVKTGQRGFTIIELIISILVLGFCLLSLIKVFSDLSVLSYGSDYRNTATMLAQELMEEIKSKRFDELTVKDANGNWSGTFGVDTGETAGTKSTFDDVDDFNSFSETLGSPFTGFTRSVSVAYVNNGAINTPLAIPGTLPADWTPNFKRVVITVGHAGMTNIQIISLVSRAKSQN